MTIPIRTAGEAILRPWETVEDGGRLAPRTSGADGSASFADLLKKAVGDASALESNAQEKIAAFLRGEPVEIHDVMAASEEAGIALDLLVEIRNKLTETYRTLMNMQ
ncbi:MAG: flagellar hook-basal body complex protein FliE [Candidatus Eisenbacteria bacterium]